MKHYDKKENIIRELTQKIDLINKNAASAENKNKEEKIDFINKV